MMNRVLRIRYVVMVLIALISFSSPAIAQQAKKKSVQKRTATTTKKSGSKKSTGKKTTTKRSASKQPVTVNSLKTEQQRVRKQIEEQQRKLKANERDVKNRLQNLLIINNEIADKRKSIDTIRHDINRLDGNIHTLEVQMVTLNKELEERKQRFIKSMKYMHRNRNLQSRLMFVFSAKNLSQMYRRLRFVREYAAYQQNQAEAVKSMKDQVTEAHSELTDTKRQKSDLLVRGERERRSLEGKQEEQQKMVSSLQKQQKTIQGIIEKQKKRDAELNAQIDRLIAQEIARAKARAEAEARRKAAEAEAKRKAEELARKQAAAEAARKENERRIAEAKAREEKAKAEARAAARKNAEEKAAAERAAAEAERARLAAERKAAADAKAHEKEVAEARKSETEVYTVSSEDRRLSGNFESNRGRLPMPIAGGYRIVNHFGTNHVTDVKGHVTLDKKGIDIKGQPGAAVRCVFDGEVSAVFSYAGTTVVIVRHGSYLSVYCDLASVNVSRGQKVSTRQTLGRVGAEGLMQFQLRKGSAKLNPEGWLAR
ncbi:Septal ring factor EnvC, activator of murein hydrolases AmiA and AmiB [Xylanibacter ruminicola]|uniref:Septal ring factor EnvC, activator of murein hydrolases AmiA and AmiB n=2 Tax=Xylanibacter ruminicola TaxID=839 RepID=A0A1M7NBX6_XYLRU|nr:M23 family metallopeptidase [Xylanibacter ruminicola]SHN01174.1 Septal ring factor EnvC, activator of murein hydrolases AmiA and AmiB [Xylanibacter ruminicola]